MARALIPDAASTAPTLIPVALRAHTVRGTDTGPDAPSSARAEAALDVPKRARTGRAEPRWPRHVLVFDTETTTDARQSLTFGSYRVSRWQSGGSLVLIEEGLFHADDLATAQPDALRELDAYATARGVTLLTRRQFMTRVFKPVAIDLRGMVVAFNLPFDLSRIAIESGDARNKFRGGFSFTLWDYQDAATGEWREHPYRPRICVKSLDSKRAFIGFSRPMTTGEPNARAFRGHFLDARTLAFALSAKSHSLASACATFGVAHGKLTVEEHGRVTADYIDYNRRDVLATEELLVTLRVEFDQLGLSLAPMRAYSPASIAKANLRAFGIRPLRTKAPGISDAEFGRCMTAFYGGRAECRIRRVPVPVVTVDFRSMYPTVNCLLDLWRVVTAARITFRDCTDEFRALVAAASLDAAFDPATWPRLCCFAEIEPDDDILPVRGKYAQTREGLNIGVNRLTSPVPMTYAGPDVYASALLTGKAPRIRHAWQLCGEGTQDDLRPVALAGRIPVNPREMDFFRTVIEERVRVKSSADYPPAERDRIAQLLKIVANSGSYGIFAEMNRDELACDDTETVTVFGHTAPFAQQTTAPENSGEFCFPPVAALIVAAARLMLALLERCVTDRGGTYAFCDTDSMAIVATERGELIECEGGMADVTDRMEAVRALSWSDVHAIQAQFDALNPYDPRVIPTILNIEDLNYSSRGQRAIYAYVVSAKRYALYSRTDTGEIQLEKCSEHGLGHLLSPLPKGSAEKWPDMLWNIIFHREFGLPCESPQFLNYPAISRISVSTPRYFRGFLRNWAELEYSARIKPFGFLVSAHVARFGHPAGVNARAFHLVAPFTANPKEWARQLWTDTYSGAEYAISTSLTVRPGVVRVRSFADVLAEFLAHGEVKSATARGEPAGASARGLLFRRHIMPSELRLIGKESNALEAAGAGLIGDWDRILSTYGDRTADRTTYCGVCGDTREGMECERPNGARVAQKSPRNNLSGSDS